jgi:replicative DNA helicase
MIVASREGSQRVPPQALDAEAWVLGAMLLDRQAVLKAIEMLDSSAFYSGSHELIFRAIVSLFDRHQAVDVVTVSDELKRMAQLESVGGASYLASLVESVPTAANLEYHARIVLEKAVLRRLIDVATEVVRNCHEAREDADRILDQAEQTIFSIKESRLREGFTPIRSILKHSFEAIEALHDRGASVTGVASGYERLDELTAGFQRGELIIVAARPSVGKTALVLNVAENASIEGGVPVAIFSLEMSREQLVQRMLCSGAHVDSRRVRRGTLHASDWPKLTTAAGRLAEAPIYVDDSSSLTWLELKAKARRLKAESDIGLLIVDYLQLLRGAGKTENRQQEVSEISRALKALSKELDVPVIAVSQLSRAPSTRGNERPVLSDLRESGALEQDADVVLFLFRDPRLDWSDRTVELIVGKQRNGPTGTVHLTFLREFTRFESQDRGREEFAELPEGEIEAEVGS